MDPILGQIQQFGFDFAPRGWQTCDGQLLSISQYSALYSLLGTIYGGDGTTTFALPDLRGRTIVHQGPNFAMGQKGGQESVTMLNATMPPHNHSVAVQVNTANGEEATPTSYIASSANTFSKDISSGPVLSGLLELPMGNGVPFSVRDPYLCVNYSIAMQGIFPSRN
jgi:microcystin-dependent protein